MSFFKDIQTDNAGTVQINTRWRPKVSGYTVYNNKVYRVVASHGDIMSLTYTIESEVTGERFSVKQPESGQLCEITSPKGYIKV